MKAVLKYPGAKNRIALWICKYIPEHRNYVEPFFGSGAIFFNKKPAYLEIINDVDDDIVNFFRVLRENEEDLIRKISFTPYSRKEYENAYLNSKEEPIERARKFAVKCWQGFGCGNRYKNGYRRGIGETSPNPAKAWKEMPETLQYAAERLKNAQIENMDAIKLINDMKGENTFIYCDPPYMQETRKRYLYNHEMEDVDHKRLLETILKSDCKIMISGYENELYNKMLVGWNKAHKETTAECSVKRTETIWYNYDLNIGIQEELFAEDSEARS